MRQVRQLEDAFRRHFAEKIRLLQNESIPKRMLARSEIDVQYDLATRNLIIGAQTYVMGMPAERIQVNRTWPKTWWDAFKDRWYPKWALRRWPASYEQINIDRQVYSAVCPHLDCAPDSEHLEWMSQQADQ